MSSYDPNYVPKKHYFLIGHKIIITNDDKILILKRSDKTSGNGMWSLPGGAMEYNESSEESILREVKEELNIEIKKNKPFKVRSRKNGEDNVVIICYTGEYDGSEIELNWEHTDYKWINPSEALSEKLTDDASFFIELFNKKN